MNPHKTDLDNAVYAFNIDMMALYMNPMAERSIKADRKGRGFESG